nr:MAG TPA: hypothetical protein [Caudoviricetes sp.]
MSVSSTHFNRIALPIFEASSLRLRNPPLRFIEVLQSTTSVLTVLHQDVILAFLLSLSPAAQTHSPTIQSYIDKNALLRRSGFWTGKTTTTPPEALRAFSSTSLQRYSRHTPDRAPIRQCPHRHHRQRKAPSPRT